MKKKIEESCMTLYLESNNLFRLREWDYYNKVMGQPSIEEGRANGAKEMDYCLIKDDSIFFPIIPLVTICPQLINYQ